MKIQTMSIVCGTTACNAKCPFCVSKTTPTADLPTEINYRNLHIACKLAEKADATTCLITGKGEPTLYPNLISKYLEQVCDHFPFIELQTNGMRLSQLGDANYLADRELAPRGVDYLRLWHEYGLNTICLSAVETGIANKKVYGVDYPNIATTAKLLHEYGYTVRLSIMMLKGYVFQPIDIKRVVDFCKENKIKQLTLRPISRPDNSSDETSEWIDAHTLTQKMLEDISDHINRHATPVLKLAHGAVVYDYEGQNLCLTNCLTTNDTDENMRQIIFYPDGTIGYDWKYKGAVLL